ncbi:MAG TPA: hypothetical protein VG962_11230 [Steroidobacteraceae bacterium]|nr:hypothetical protein [Steroidobacteraceae bacterium]
MASPLTDLDEMILKCRDDRTKTYIAEAVASYRAGAFRSSIVGAWIAVCFDVIEKLRELALSGDKEAEMRIDELEKMQRSGDITNALRFERELLKLARDKFELISHLEFIDLERLQEDRNRCAHPSLVSEGRVFSPSAELARVHLYSAVTHLLQHPPVQGKYALDKLVSAVDSEYFPEKKDTAKDSLASGPLRRPRESLVRNFVIVLLKRLIKEDIEWNHKRRVAAALASVFELHPHYYADALKEKLSPMLRSLSDQELKRVINFFRMVMDTWQYVEVDLRHRIEAFVSALPVDLLDELDFLLRFEPLQKHASSRVSRITRAELKETLFFSLPMEVADRFIALYLESRNFNQANEWAKQLAIYVSDFNEEQIRRIVTGAAGNDQILNSIELGALLKVLRGSKKISPAEFDSLLMASGLSRYVSINDDE